MTKRILISVFIIILIALAAFFIFQKEDPAPPFSQETAETLTHNYISRCDIGTEEGMPCEVHVTYKTEGKKVFVVATFSKLRDDSIAAEQVTAEAKYSLGEWSLGERKTTVKCQPERGHQDFSNEPCL
ncbi:MAG TPA: hypothetical protein VEC13_02470 [Candidatus Paceibacterota bacterium]|nr:hypothetical protein [Candidatus Paceibacterota bacterium]